MVVRKWVLPSLMMGLAAIASYSAVAAEPIGVAGAVNKTVSAVGEGNAVRTLNAGDAIHFMETIKTDATGKAQLIFNDKSSLTVSPNAELMIDEFVFDPATKDGSLSVKSTKGVFRFIGGALSKKKPVKLKTPVATIGIRGGIAMVEVGPQGETNASFLFGDSMTMESGGVTKTVNTPGFGMSANSANTPPSNPFRVNLRAVSRSARGLVTGDVDGPDTGTDGSAPEGNEPPANGDSGGDAAGDGTASGGTESDAAGNENAGDAPDATPDAAPGAANDSEGPTPAGEAGDSVAGGDVGAGDPAGSPPPPPGDAGQPPIAGGGPDNYNDFAGGDDAGAPPPPPAVPFVAPPPPPTDSATEDTGQKEPLVYICQFGTNICGWRKMRDLRDDEEGQVAALIEYERNGTVEGALEKASEIDYDGAVDYVNDQGYEDVPPPPPPTNEQSVTRNLTGAFVASNFSDTGSPQFDFGLTDVKLTDGNFDWMAETGGNVLFDGWISFAGLHEPGIHIKQHTSTSAAPIIFGDYSYSGMTVASLHKHAFATHLFRDVDPAYQHTMFYGDKLALADLPTSGMSLYQFMPDMLQDHRDFGFYEFFNFGRLPGTFDPTMHADVDSPGRGLMIDWSSNQYLTGSIDWNFNQPVTHEETGLKLAMGNIYRGGTTSGANSSPSFMKGASLRFSTDSALGQIGWTFQGESASRNTYAYGSPDTGLEALLMDATLPAIGGSFSQPAFRIDVPTLTETLVTDRTNAQPGGVPDHGFAGGLAFMYDLLAGGAPVPLFNEMAGDLSMYRTYGATGGVNLAGGKMLLGVYDIDGGGGLPGPGEFKIKAAFGHIPGWTDAPSVLLSDSLYGMELAAIEYFDGAASVAGLTATDSLDTSGTRYGLALSGSFADNSDYTNGGTRCAQCEYVSWGVWGGEAYRPGGSGNPDVYSMIPYVHGQMTENLGNVASEIAAQNGGDIVNYSGFAMGNLFDNGVLSNARGDLTAQIDITDRQINQLAIQNFGGQNYGFAISGPTGVGVIAGSGAAVFSGIDIVNMAGTPTGAGKINGALFGPMAENIGGNFVFNGGPITAGGVFLGHR